MSALLTDNLPLLAGAPNGIQKLRELILELAVRGKLVPQDPSDEPASELLNRIAEEKARLVAEGKIRKQKPLAEIGEEEKPLGLPDGWIAARLGELVNIGTGKLDANAAVENGRYPFFTCSQTPSRIDSFSYETSAVLLAGNGDFNLKKYTGKFDAYQRTYVIEPVVWGLDFCFITVSAEIERVTENNRGSAIPYLKLGDITNPVVWLPPLAEQHRIVAKVDELMALCDRLEARQADAESAHARLVQALLESLTQASDADDFAASWQRLAEHFHSLFTSESSIDALKQTLLQLAVMGKLVSQDQGDEPASELLKRIAAEKVRLVAEGKLKRQKPLAEIGEEEKPFELPEGWEWVRLDLLLSKIGAGSTPLGGKQAYVAEGIKFLRSQNVWNEGLQLDDVAMIPDATHQKMSGTHVQAGDLLFNITGASIGRCAVVPDDFDAGNVNQHVTIVRPLLSELKRFLHVVLTSPLVQQTVMDVQVGVSREGLSIGKLALFVIPCPPEAEQHRIVAKLDQLLALCDQLKARLTATRQLHERLAGALVEQAVA